MYDTSNPYSWKYYKTVLYPYGQWTITDASLSPDNKLLAYSSIRPTVCLAPTDPGETGEPWLLDFSDMTTGTSRQRPFRGAHRNFGVASLLVRNQEVTDECLDMVYTILRRWPGDCSWHIRSFGPCLRH